MTGRKYRSISKILERIDLTAPINYEVSAVVYI